MAYEEDNLNELTEHDHQAAFIFNPSDDGEQPDARPSKRRKVSKKGIIARDQEKEAVNRPVSGFVPLFNGAESPRCVALREEIFAAAWSRIDTRIEHTLREANRNTLDEVRAFVQDAPSWSDRIPAAYIITGPNTASQQLLFDQLADSLQDLAKPAKFVSIRSAEAPNLKATLKKIIRDATSRLSDDEDELDMGVGQDGRKYLDYDLEALYAFMKPHGTNRIMVAFRDTEAFDSGLLSDLVMLLNSWRDRLQFTLLFGIATSVELFQARLLKSTAQHLFGRQFDVVQASSVLESIFKAGVAHLNCMLRLGPSLLRVLVDRQKEQVVGIQGFISSLKYAYMCHFYANPLSIILAENKTLLREVLQPEHIEAVRTLDSFREAVDFAVAEAKNPVLARRLLEDDGYIVDQICREGSSKEKSTTVQLRALLLMRCTGASTRSFIDDYIAAISLGINPDNDDSSFANSIRQLQPDDVVSLARRLLTTIDNGDVELGVAGWTEESKDLVSLLKNTIQKVKSLQDQAKMNGASLRSKYSAQSRVLRTTVVAQKVQLSQDSAKLTDEDKAFTEIMDSLARHLSLEITCSIGGSLLSEAWVYDSKSPIRDVFIPRPGTTIEKALSRPHDYLACKCCGDTDRETAPTFPSTAILYRLYSEAGAIVNVADLWSAYYALVGGQDDEGGVDEREALVRFYQGLAQLKTMGFVKQSKKKADHIAKLKWL